MNKVGFMNLKEGNVFELREEIQRLLKNKWLDNETVEEFHKQAYSKDPLKLKAIKAQIQSEIDSRKKAYGA